MFAFYIKMFSFHTKMQNRRFQIPLFRRFLKARDEGPFVAYNRFKSLRRIVDRYEL